MKISYKLMTLIGVTVGVMLLLSILQWTSLNKLRDYEYQQRLINEIETDMLKLRTNEKDFLIRKNTKYIDAFNATYKGLTNKFNKLNEGIKAHDIETDKVETAIADIDTYKNKFDQVAKTQSNIGFSDSDGLNGALREQAEEAEASIKDMFDFRLLSRMLQLRRNEKDFMLRNDLTYLIDFEDNMEKITQLLSNAPESDSIMTNKVKGHLEVYYKEFHALVKESEKLGLSEEQGLLGDMKTAVDKVEKSMNELLSELEDIIKSKESSQLTFNFILSAILVLGIIGASFALSRSIVNPLQQMRDAVDDLRDGEGDLTYRLPDLGKDEIGQTAYSLNRFIEKIHKILLSVHNEAENLASASFQVNETAQSLSQTATEQAASVEETSASIEQMTASISQNTENAKETESIASSTAQQASEGGEAVTETVTAMQKIAERIGFIEDIAYKTNLLALNAAIEAARAGEHGRGFAVVADEVRKLAERSQTSAQEISELAASSVKVADHAGQLITKMVPNIQKTAKLVQEITAASTEQASGVNQVNTAIVQLDRGAQHGASAAEELAATAEEMSNQIIGLRKTIDLFKLVNDGDQAFEIEEEQEELLSAGNNIIVKQPKQKKLSKSEQDSEQEEQPQKNAKASYPDEKDFEKFE